MKEHREQVAILFNFLNKTNKENINRWILETKERLLRRSGNPANEFKMELLPLFETNTNLKLEITHLLTKCETNMRWRPWVN